MLILSDRLSCYLNQHKGVVKMGMCLKKSSRRLGRGGRIGGCATKRVTSGDTNQVKGMACICLKLP